LVHIVVYAFHPLLFAFVFYPSGIIFHEMFVYIAQNHIGVTFHETVLQQMLDPPPDAGQPVFKIETRPRMDTGTNFIQQFAGKIVIYRLPGKTGIMAKGNDNPHLSMIQPDVRSKTRGYDQMVDYTFYVPHYIFYFLR